MNENLNRVIRYISDDGLELLLNFVTFEDKFILRAIPKCEQRVFLREKMWAYYDRVMDNSFLQHIYGVFKLTIKGQDYRLSLVENNPEGYVSRGSINLSSKSSGADQLYFIGDVGLEDKFYLDIDLKKDFRQTLKKDLEYLEKAKIQSCKIFIDVLVEPPSGNRKVYSGIYKDRPAFLSVRIFDVIYTEFNEKSTKIRTSGIEMVIDLATLAKAESLIKAHIS